MHHRTMLALVAFGLSVVAVTLMAAEVWPAQTARRQFPQTIRYEIHEDSVIVQLETPRWPDEPVGDWIERNTAAWKAWETRYGQAMQDMDDQRRAAEDHDDPGD